MKMLIGITGGVGSGKTEVTRYLRRCGEVVICADETARKVVQPGQEGAVAIRAAFGDDFFFPSGELNRRKLAAYVFGNESHLARLNNLLHPIIIADMFSEAEKHSGRVFLDAALLIQTGMHKKTHAVWLVTADIQKRISRVMLRDALSREDVLQRIQSQLSDENMKHHADEVIENNGSVEELHNRINELLYKYARCDDK